MRRSKEYIQLFVDVLLHHKAKQKCNRIKNIVSVEQTLIYKQQKNSNIKIFSVLIKHELCTNLKLVLNLSHSDP